MIQSFQRFLPIISSLALVFSAAFLAHTMEEKRVIQQAIDELSTYEIKVIKEKKALSVLSLLRKEMEKKGLTGKEEGVNLEATFVVMNFKTFLEKLSDIYYRQGFFFLTSFKEKTEPPSSQRDGVLQEPIALAKISGKKVVSYKP